MFPFRIFLIILFTYNICNYVTVGWLLFPASTVLQITMSVSAPVELKDMRLYFDWGFQVNYNLPYDLSNFYDVAKWPGHSRQHTRAISYDKYNIQNNTHPADATAGEVYMALEELMIGLGFHETCLLKSVCEVARHPFDLESENLIAEIINFVLSPSHHKSFGDNEKVYRAAYESAERYGASGVDCDFIYPECPVAFVEAVTKVEFE